MAAKETGSSDESDCAGEGSSNSQEPIMHNLQKKFLGLLKKCPKDESVLPSLDLDGVIDYIKSGKCSHIITLSGAGISTSAGIPDFRSTDSGLYNKLQKYNLPYPGAIFELEYFKKNPEPFFALVKDAFPAKLDPTPCHYFIRVLHEKGLLLRHYTQNIDTLERMAGLPPEKLIEAHGTFNTGHCLKCRREYTQEWMKEQIFKNLTPHCEKPGCTGVVKPDIIFFGESMPTHFFTACCKDFKKCDLLIVLGTSLVVQPFASLVSKVKSCTPRLYINWENRGDKAGFKYSKSGNYRDVFWKGSCDDGCMEIARGLGWEKEVMDLVAARQASKSPQ